MADQITRDDFIDAYMERAGMSVVCRTEDGFVLGDRRRVALFCACGHDICEGWAMIPVELQSDHERQNLSA